MTVSRATIVSPIYANGYIGDFFCGLTINVAERKLLLINFEQFDVGSNNRHCDNHNDYLEIRDGSSIHSNLIGPKLCGLSTLRPILSFNNSVTLRFFTNMISTGSNLDGRSSFKLTAIEVVSDLKMIS